MTSILCSVFCFAMAAFNLYRTLGAGGTANMVYAVVWLVIGIVNTILYLQRNNKDEK